MQAGGSPSNIYVRKLIGLGVLTLVFGTTGVVLLVAALVYGWPWSVYVGVALALVTALICLGGWIGMLRERLSLGSLTDEDLRPVRIDRPLPEPTTPKAPWEWDDVARAVALAFDEAPYIVTADAKRIRIAVDIADSRWTHLVTRRGHRTAFVALLTRTKPGRARRNDVLYRVDTSAGPSGLGAVAAVSSGRAWTFQRRKEYALNRHGFHKVMDVQFTTSDVNVPLDDAFKKAGWKQTLDAEAKGAAVLAGLGLLAIPAVPIALLISSITGD